MGGVSPGLDRTRTLRGAVCGAVAAAVWGLQQPLDKLVFSSRYDDVELVGKAAVRGDAFEETLRANVWEPVYLPYRRRK